MLLHSITFLLEIYILIPLISIVVALKPFPTVIPAFGMDGRKVARSPPPFLLPAPRCQPLPLRPLSKFPHSISAEPQQQVPLLSSVSLTQALISKLQTKTLAAKIQPMFHSCLPSGSGNYPLTLSYKPCCRQVLLSPLSRYEN